MKHGSIIASWRVNGRVLTGNKPSAGRIMLTLFFTLRAQYWNIIKRGAQL
jgi:hypothetical protein